MHGTRRVLLAGAATLGLALVQLPGDGPAAAMPSDFNGDGYADLAIGVPARTSARRMYAGAVNVLVRLEDRTHRRTRPALEPGRAGRKGKAQKDDNIGFRPRVRATSTATAMPTSRSVSPMTTSATFNAGAVNILYGSKRGLTAAGDQRWSGPTCRSAAEDGSFGESSRRAI